MRPAIGGPLVSPVRRRNCGLRLERQCRRCPARPLANAMRLLLLELVDEALRDERDDDDDNDGNDAGDNPWIVGNEAQIHDDPSFKRDANASVGQAQSKRYP
mgnify:FL=1